MNENPYDLDFYKKSIRSDRQHSYKEIARYLYETYKPYSAIDYGCGCGWILDYLKSFGVSEVVGFEKSLAAKEVREGIDPILRSDVNIVFGVDGDLINGAIFKHLDRLYDMAICVEGAEHIPDKYSEILVQNITKNTNLLIFSAAPPGKGGVDHVNERTWTYWKNRFNKVGFEQCLEQTETMQHYLKSVQVKSWYSNNMRVLRRS